MYQKQPPTPYPRFFYIDIENTQLHGLDDITKLDEQDTVVIVYTSHSCRANFDRVADILNTKAKVICLKVRADGKNAADFQLITIAVLNAERLPDNVEHIIVSHDKGYDLAIETAAKLSVHNIYRQTNLLNKPEQATPPVPKNDASAQKPTSKNVTRCLHAIGVPENKTSMVITALKGSHDKRALHNKLASLTSQKEAAALYTICKPHTELLFTLIQKDT